MNKKIRRPTHPGAILREDILPDIGANQTEFALSLGVSPRTISNLLHERSRLSADLAHRIARRLGMSPEIWLRMQQAVDLHDLEIRNSRVYNGISRIENVAA